ncbi:hypothetical protein [uncultured Umboniibacter sp.]|uniref:hypothetical protein n=1 Tax=uncultured Umboniibacter sp. TaxID=1798917 RepID=UPI00261A417A|nr:hypothetical protein [uncultured Umboniibacter sp.]
MRVSTRAFYWPFSTPLVFASGAFFLNYHPIGYRLSAIGYRLSAIGYRLSAIGYRLSTIGYPLSRAPGHGWVCADATSVAMVWVVIRDWV